MDKKEKYKKQYEKDMRVYGKKRCPLCKTTISTNWKFCASCKKKYGK